MAQKLGLGVVKKKKPTKAELEKQAEENRKKELAKLGIVIDDDEVRKKVLK